MGNRNTNLRRWAVVALVAMMAMAAGQGAADAFILSAGIGTIVVTFDSPVYGVRFDYELFPERNCSVRAAIDLTGIDLIVAGRRHRSVDEPRARCPGSALPSSGPVPGPPGRALGERKVDVVVEAPMDDRPIVAVAHATGVRL